MPSRAHNHPPLKPIELDEPSQLDEVSLFQGLPMVRVPHDSAGPPPELLETAFLGFGGKEHDTDWDTLCITALKNRLPLREHPMFESSMGPLRRYAGRVFVKVVDIPGKGRGLVAAVDILETGRLFALERPLLICRGSLSSHLIANFTKLLDQGLTDQHKKEYYQLHNCKSKEPGMIEAISIMRTNGFGIDYPFDTESQRAVFDVISRANHSCVPNAYFEWDFKVFSGLLRPLVPIEKGEEITISYTSLLVPASERKADLLRKYGFECTCPACSLPPRLQKESDQRRVALIDRINRGRALRADTAVIHAGFDDSHIMESLNMCETEGLVYTRAEMMYWYAVWEIKLRAIRTGDWSRAEALAHRAIEETQKIGAIEFVVGLQSLLLAKPGTRLNSQNIADIVNAIKSMALTEPKPDHASSSSRPSNSAVKDPEWSNLVIPVEYIARH
ncbi:SET domain-containing protein [Dacryopinax primogenitus]|uniref:SET domain-containing protein n=1 Tax=Dacryopinax primogenitus (strain DJM 731) TaxID=1858805 RepID=M5G477_DACPD|nr:SET domain-containing protein [Dacryopinax primogenitus]EJU03020.1 SET domain-containing protein [Dacryopinax primogenitus]